MIHKATVYINTFRLIWKAFFLSIAHLGAINDDINKQAAAALCLRGIERGRREYKEGPRKFVFSPPSILKDVPNWIPMSRKTVLDCQSLEIRFRCGLQYNKFSGICAYWVFRNIRNDYRTSPVIRAAWWTGSSMASAGQLARQGWPEKIRPAAPIPVKIYSTELQIFNSTDLSLSHSACQHFSRPLF